MTFARQRAPEGRADFTPAAAWVTSAVAHECEHLEHNRRRFVHEPDEERLHAVRTTGRRLRSLLEDASDLVDCGRLARLVKRAARCTDEARDAAVIRDLLLRSLDDGEREQAGDVLERLRKRERRATRTARKVLRHVRFHAP